MQRTLLSNVRFERAVGALFEQFEGRESELRSALRSVLVGLRTGDIKEIRQHNPNDTTACIPLIDNFVVVLEPMDNFFFVSRRSSKLGMISAESLIDITGTKLIDLLTIEQEAH